MVKWLGEPELLEALAPSWPAVLPPDSTPFDLLDWYAAWWRAFGGSGGLAVCAIERGGEPVAVLPALESHGALRGLANHHSGSFRPLAADPDAMEALLAAVLGRRAREVSLPLLSVEDSGYPELKAAVRRSSKLAIEEPGPVSPIVDTGGTWEGWFKGEHASWKGRLARYRRKMGRDHDASFEIAVAPDDLDTWLEQGFALEASSWKGRAGTAIDSATDTAGFYRDIARRFHRRGELRLSRILLDGQPVAFSFCILHRNRLYSLKTGYDEAWKKIVPGLVLQLSIVERCFELGLEAYELLGEGSDWKWKMSDASRAHTNLKLYSRGPSGLTRYAYRSALRPGLKRAHDLVTRRR